MIFRNYQKTSFIAHTAAWWLFEGKKTWQKELLSTQKNKSMAAPPPWRFLFIDPLFSPSPNFQTMLVFEFNDPFCLLW